MASRHGTVDFLVEQIEGAGSVSARKMFGEYGIYCDGRMVALVCDDRLFVKATPGGRAHIGDVVEASPYPGAKPCFAIPEDRWDDGDWLADLIRISVRELPPPKPKKVRA